MAVSRRAASTPRLIGTSELPGSGHQDPTEQVQVKDKGNNEYQAPPSSRTAKHDDDYRNPDCQQQPDYQRQLPMPQIPVHCHVTLQLGELWHPGAAASPAIANSRRAPYHRLGALPTYTSLPTVNC